MTTNSRIYHPIVKAKLYPIMYMADFKHFFNEEWLKSEVSEYFAQKTPAALPYIDRIKPISNLK